MQKKIKDFLFSERNRLILPINLICFCSMSLLCIFIVIESRYAFNRIVELNLESTLASIETACRDPIINYDIVSITSIAKTSLVNSDMISAEILNPSMVPIVVQKSAGKDGESSVTRLKEINDFENKLIGFVRITYSKERIENFFWRIVAGCLFSTFIIQGVVFFVSKKAVAAEMKNSDLRHELDVKNAIAQESKKVKIMVDNMQQALFPVDSKGNIVEPVSNYSSGLFGGPVVNKNIADVLYGNLSHEEISLVQSSLISVTGESMLQWDLSAHLFPKKITIPSSSEPGKSRVLKIQISPVLNDQEVLEQILFVVEDVTALELLEQQTLEIGRKSKALNELMSNRPQEIINYFSAAQKLLDTLQNSSIDLNQESYAILKREFHTLKGNSRYFRLSFLSDQVHNAEEALNKIKSKSFLEISLIVTNEIAQIQSIIDFYQGILKTVSSFTKPDREPKINLEALENAKKVIASELSLPKAIVLKIHSLLDQITHKSVAEMAASYKGMVEGLANQLGKKVTLKISGDAFLPDSHCRKIQECFLHILRNAVDHGIELPPDRISSNKPETGVLSVECSETENGISIIIKDDGFGIDDQRLLGRSVSKGLVSSAEASRLNHQQILNLVFVPGFSTKEAVSDISGRGIGMDVVKSNIEYFGGVIEIGSQNGVGTTFKIHINLQGLT